MLNLLAHETKFCLSRISLNAFRESNMKMCQRRFLLNFIFFFLYLSIRY